MPGTEIAVIRGRLVTRNQTSLLQWRKSLMGQRFLDSFFTLFSPLSAIITVQDIYYLKGVN